MWPEWGLSAGAVAAPGGSAPAAAGASSPQGFGSYSLLQKIGEGEVWLAEQTVPVRRQVALKVIKAGMDTAQVVSRSIPASSPLQTAA